MLTATICALSALSTSVSLPEDRTVTWTIHETPSDPNSDIVFTISALLTADSESGSAVGWDILKIDFTQIVSGGPNNLWRIDNPDLGTSDGLWWIEHNNTKNPAEAEFTEPPTMSDTADAITSGLANLDYSIESHTPPSGPYTTTSKLTYELIRVGETTPEEEGDEEPVDTVDDTQ